LPLKWWYSLSFFLSFLKFFFYLKTNIHFEYHLFDNQHFFFLFRLFRLDQNLVVCDKFLLKSVPFRDEIFFFLFYLVFSCLFSNCLVLSGLTVMFFKVYEFFFAIDPLIVVWNVIHIYKVYNFFVGTLVALIWIQTIFLWIFLPPYMQCIVNLVCKLQHLQVLYLFSSISVSLPWSSKIFQSIKF
jgi:hypothetical protein